MAHDEERKVITIKRWDFITIAIMLCAVLLVGVPLLISGCAKPSHDTDDIDGGVQHSVDTGAPKTIYSTKIISFHCEFSTTDLMMDSSPIAGRYHTLHAECSGANYEARGGGTVYDEREFTPDEAFFDALQQIVAKYDFAQYNGQYYTVSGLPPDHGAKLEILYDSEESIHSSNNQSCFIPLEAMEELVNLFYPDNSIVQEQE